MMFEIKSEMYLRSRTSSHGAMVRRIDSSWWTIVRGVCYNSLFWMCTLKKKKKKEKKEEILADNLVTEPSRSVL